VSGAFTYTPALIAAGAAKLDASRGEDKYVDPQVYLDAYTDWTVNKHGLPQDFIKNFPPKVYVNPKNNTLPAILQSGSGAFSDSNDLSSQIDSL
jgi:hypothetical protein